MPRLLSLNNYHYRRGGSDVVFLDHDALFAGRGWDTAVLSMHHPSNLPSDWSEYFVDEIEYDHHYPLRKRLAQVGKVIWSHEAARKLERLLQRFPADIVHAHCIYHHLSPSVLAQARRHGIPIVMTQHDLKLACPAYKMLNAEGVCERCRGGNLLHLARHRCVRNSTAASLVVMAESAIHRAIGAYRDTLDRLIAPSRFYIDKLVEWGWDRARLRYVPNAVDVSRFEPGNEPGQHFLYFGRLAPEKGLATLIRATAIAGQRLVIAGTGPLHTELQAQACALGAHVRFVGHQSGQALHTLIREARAVVLPSEWYENAPMSVLEAYALATPVIGAAIGGIPELIDEDTGWTFPAADEHALAERLSTVAAAPDQRIRAMGAAARRRVERSFSIDRYYDAICGVYAELGVANRISGAA